MECTLAALIACLSWSNLFIDSGLSYQDSGVERITNRASYDFYGGEYHLMHASTSISSDAHNPYGRFAIGYQLDFSRVVVSLEASHVSSLATNEDRGVNSISLRARWFPFR